MLDNSHNQVAALYCTVQYSTALDISYNQVAALPPWLLAASLNTELSIRGNPFHCTCHNFRQYSNFFEVIA